uniref:Uncharacterized protein n=1 Tax=Arundo donax TaxID=35708 RepID=A0A0A8YE49_ARUDO
MHDNRLDFPEPTTPHMATFIPLFTFNSTSVRVGEVASGSQLNIPLSISTS